MEIESEKPMEDSKSEKIDKDELIRKKQEIIRFHRILDYSGSNFDFFGRWFFSKEINDHFEHLQKNNEDMTLFIEFIYKNTGVASDSILFWLEFKRKHPRV